MENVKLLMIGNVMRIKMKKIFFTNKFSVSFSRHNRWESERQSTEVQVAKKMISRYQFELAIANEANTTFLLVRR